MQSDRPTPARADLLRTIGIAAIFTLYMAVVFGFGLYLFAILVTYMRQDLGFDIVAVGMITGAAQISFLAAALLCAQLTRRIGGGTVIVGAVVMAGSLLVALSAVQNVWQAAALLIALGACAALMVIPTVGVVGRVVPFAYRSSVNGLISSGTAYGQFANGLIVPFFILNYDWRALWVAVGLASIAIALTGYLVLRVLAADVFAPDAKPAQAKRTDTPGWAPRFAALATRQNLTIWTLLALSGMACGPWQNYLSSFLRDEQGHTVIVIGQLWSIIGIVGLGSGFAIGLLADRIGVRLALAMSYGVLLIAGGLIAMKGDPSTLRMAAVAFGLAFYAVYGLIPAYISKSATPDAATGIFAIANVFLGIGTTFGNIGGGYLQTGLGSFQGIYLGVASIAALGIVLTLFLPDERQPKNRAVPQRLQPNKI